MGEAGGLEVDEPGIGRAAGAHQQIVGLRIPVAERQERARLAQLRDGFSQFGRHPAAGRNSEGHGLSHPYRPAGGEETRCVRLAIDRAQGGPAGVVGIGPPRRGRAQPTERAGEGGQPHRVSRRTVADEQPVQGDAGCEILQYEQPGGQVAGDHTGREAYSEVLPEEPQRGTLGG
ncbi:hypothetical protein OG244_12455 [Streptomyces brevispora]|uniref:hypothetical protein n=1 Tax=Streptomyces brevispora TaxID=887462 RepID=UPI002E2FC07E|nr:hypothetical protein [Streptomyces brevispora]